MSKFVQALATFLSIAETADSLSLSEATIRRGIAAGTIPAVKILGSVRVPLAYIEGLADVAIATPKPKRPVGRPRLEGSGR